MPFCKISKSNLFYNLNQFTEIMPLDKIGIVLKRNAYGHGLLEIAKLLNEFGIRHVIVKDLDEANKIKNLFETILVLYGVPKNTIQPNISITINSLNDILKIPAKTSVELKVDTGMHRNGISPEDLHEAIGLIKERDLSLKGIFTQFASANENSPLIFDQKKVFDDVIAETLSFCWRIRPRFHCSNTAGTVRFDNKNYDLVRIGLGAYGYIDIDKKFNTPELKPVMSLWANKIASRDLAKGESVGYGAGYTSEKRMTVSTYDIGYGDGVFRSNENKKVYLDDGSHIMGRTSMDCFSAQGDRSTICVFSDARELAHINKTIVYEIIVRIDQNIKRVIVD